MESRHPAWRTNTRVKGSDGRPFILILDLILDLIMVYATLIMGMKFPPYPNLCKVEKIKSTLTILQKNFYSVYLTHQLIANSGKSVYNKAFLFLIASEWSSPIIVSTPFFL